MKRKIRDLAAITFGVAVYGYAIGGFFYDWETPGIRMLMMGMALVVVLLLKKETE